LLSGLSENSLSRTPTVLAELPLAEPTPPYATHSELKVSSVVTLTSLGRMISPSLWVTWR
jgi:hypothetical protein